MGNLHFRQNFDSNFVGNFTNFKALFGAVVKDFVLGGPKFSLKCELSISTLQNVIIFVNIMICSDVKKIT